MNGVVVSAAGLTGAAVLVGLTPGGGVLMRRVAGVSGSVVHRSGAWRRPGRARWGLAFGGAVVVGSATGRILLALVVPALAATIMRMRQRAVRDARAAGERVRVREFAELLAAELRAGRPARAALATAARDVLPAPEWAAEVSAAAESGADVVDALGAASSRPGAEGLRELAACWRVGERAGAGLAVGVAQLAHGLREREAHRAHIAAQLAGVRAAGYLLAGLPFFGLVLGTGLGARPWHVLLRTPGGNAALVAGLALDVAGIAWLAALARSAEAAG